MRKIEILAPAGSAESMRAAFAAGADAVYMGGSRFGARAYAENADEDGLRAAIDYAHRYGRKLYMTVNTLLTQQELQEELFRYMRPYYEAGLDAVLVQDFGVMKSLHEMFPDLPLHASTQMTVTSTPSLSVLAGYGIRRIVPARELSYAEIAKLKAESGLEIEVFVHGALCYCYSGQCLMSSFSGGRSGNRGRCAQPCRKIYQLAELAGGQENPAEGGRGTEERAGAWTMGNILAEGSLLSPKDICLLSALPALIDAGVDSLKIEGRMKRPEYAALTSSIYRRYADLCLEGGAEALRAFQTAHRTQWEEDNRLLSEIYNRGGFSGGYLDTWHGPQMMSMARANHSGVQVGKTLSADSDHAVIRFTRKMQAQDVLEFRHPARPVTDAAAFSVKTAAVRGSRFGYVFGTQGKPGYEFTLKDAHAEGETLTVPILHGSDVLPGDNLYRTRDNALIAKLDAQYLSGAPKIPAEGNFTARIGAPAVFRVRAGSAEAAAEGMPVQAARNLPTGAEEVKRILSQTGETPYTFRSLELELDEGIFLPVGALKELRRQALAALEEAVCAPYRREFKENERKDAAEMADLSDKIQFTADSPAGLAVRVSTAAQLEAALAVPEVRRVYLPLAEFSEEEWKTAAERIHETGREAYAVLWRVLRGSDPERISELYHRLPADGIEADSIDAAVLAVKLAGRGHVTAGPMLYAENLPAMEFLRELGIGAVTASYELSRQQTADLKAGEILPLILPVYGRIPLMASVQCLLDNTTGCRRKKNGTTGGWYLMRGPMDDFLVHPVCRYCSNEIYSLKPLSLSGRSEQVKALQPAALRLDFTTEDRMETAHVLQVYADLFCRGRDHRPEGTEGDPGHFETGVL